MRLRATLGVLSLSLLLTGAAWPNVRNDGNCALVDSDALYVSRPPLCRQGQPQRQLAIRADVAIMKSSSADGTRRPSRRRRRSISFRHRMRDVFGAIIVGLNITTRSGSECWPLIRSAMVVHRWRGQGGLTAVCIAPLRGRRATAIRKGEAALAIATIAAAPRNDCDRSWSVVRRAVAARIGADMGCEPRRLSSTGMCRSATSRARGCKFVSSRLLAAIALFAVSTVSTHAQTTDWTGQFSSNWFLGATGTPVFPGRRST